MDEIAKRLARLGSRLVKGAERLHPLTPTQKVSIQSALAAQLEQRMSTQSKADIGSPNLLEEKRAKERLNEASKIQSKDQSQGQSHGN